MTERQVTIVNQLGLHARAAAKLVHSASAFVSDVWLVRDGEEADAKSILGVLLLAAPQGAQLTIRCNGADEEQALSSVVKLFADGFGEDS